MALITKEQEKEIQEYLNVKNNYIETLDSLINSFEDFSTKYLNASNEIQDILNDGDYKTEQLFIKERLENGSIDYRPEFQIAINNNRNPYTYFSENIENIYTNEVKPINSTVSGFTYLPYTTDYFNLLETNKKYVEEGNSSNIGLKLTSLLEAIKNSRILKVKRLVTNLLPEYKPFIEKVKTITSIYFSLLYYGNVTNFNSSEYRLTLPTAPFTINKLFSNGLFGLYFETFTNELYSTLKQLDLDFKKYTSDKAIELEDLNQVLNLQKDADKATETFKKGLGTEYTFLKEYIEDIVIKNEESFNRLISFTGEEKTNLIEAVSPNYNIFQYLFNSDPRIIPIYNNAKNLENPREGRVDYLAYNPNYYNNWFSNYEKIIPGTPNFENIEEKLNLIKTKLETENLLTNDITSLNVDINYLLDLLVLQVLPGVQSFYHKINFFKEDLNNNETRSLLYKKLNIKIEPDLELHFNKEFLTEIAGKVNALALTKVETLISQLEELKLKVKEDTIEDLAEAYDTSKAELNIANLNSSLEVLQKEAASFCKEVETVKSNNISTYVKTPSLYTDTVIYKLLKKTEGYDSIYKKKAESLKDLYKPLTEKLKEDSDSYDTFCQCVVKEECLKTLNTRINNLKLANTSKEEETFNSEKEAALSTINSKLFNSILSYFVTTSIFNTGDTSVSRDLILNNSDYKTSELTKLPLNSYKIVEELIKLHKELTNLKFFKEDIEKLVDAQDKTTLDKTIEKVNKDNERKAQAFKQPDLPKENWGIRISPANSRQKVSIQTVEDLSAGKEGTDDKSEKDKKEEEVNKPEILSLEQVYKGKSWYMMLLPTMNSNLPVTGGSQAPGVQPGLNFRIVNSLVKHKIPGFAPIYQPMGIDTINCSIVGCFTGADGTDRYSIGNVKSFTEKSSNYSRDLYGINGEIGGGPDKFLELANKFDSFENFQAFYNEIIETNKEIEVEINLKKNTNVLANGSEGIFRDKETGNPKFQGYIKKFDTYYVRDDRTWYIMDIQLTTNNVKKECLNLTNVVSTTVPKISKEDVQSPTQHFKFLKDCLFKDTKNDSEGMPKLFKGSLANSTIFIGTLDDEFLRKWGGVTLKNKTDSSSFLSINKQGYSIQYTRVRRGSGYEYELTGSNPKSPAETFSEIDNSIWATTPQLISGIKYHTIKDFRSSPKSEGSIQIEKVGPLLKLRASHLSNIKPVGDTRAKPKKGYINVNTQYNAATGNLIELDRSSTEYKIKDALNPVRLSNNTFYLNNKIGTFKDINTFLDYLKANAYINFKDNNPCKPTDSSESSSNSATAANNSYIEEEEKPLQESIEIEPTIETVDSNPTTNNTVNKISTFILDKEIIKDVVVKRAVENKTSIESEYIVNKEGLVASNGPYYTDEKVKSVLEILDYTVLKDAENQKDILIEAAYSKGLNTTNTFYYKPDPEDAEYSYSNKAILKITLNNNKIESSSLISEELYNSTEKKKVNVPASKKVVEPTLEKVETTVSTFNPKKIELSILKKELIKHLLYNNRFKLTLLEKISEIDIVDSKLNVLLSNFKEATEASLQENLVILTAKPVKLKENVVDYLIIGDFVNHDFHPFYFYVKGDKTPVETNVAILKIRHNNSKIETSLLFTEPSYS